jgi:hypothetical protein
MVDATPTQKMNTRAKCLATRAQGKSKIDVGYYAITSLACDSLGGCYDLRNEGPICFKPDPSILIPTNNSPKECARTKQLGNSYKNAGFSGITQEECQLVGACYDETNNGPSCFVSNPE